GFPDLIEALRLPGAIDGELLIMRDGRVQSFNVLQQRLNRKTVNAKLLAEFPAHLRAYDLLVDGEEDLRERPFTERRRRLEQFIARLDEPRVDLSPLMTFATWDDLAVARKKTPQPRVPAPTPKRSKASCSNAAMHPICPAVPRARGGNGNAIHSSSMRC